MKIKNLLLALMGIFFFYGCESDDENLIDTPETYSFERDEVSTVNFTGQTLRIGMGEELISALRDPSTHSKDLLEMYRNQSADGNEVDPYSDPTLNASAKSIKSKVAASADFFSDNVTESALIKEDFERWILAQVDEVFPNSETLAAPGVPGQIADGSSARYVNGDGVEYDQLVNKGLIGALMVDQMVNNYLSPAVLDAGSNRSDNDAGITAEGKSYTVMEHKWDEAYGYLFGASVNAADPLPTLGEDSFLNKYLRRVENDEDFSGIARDIWSAFKLGRAAIVAGDYEERDEQAEIITDLVSEVIAIRAVYYLQQGKRTLPDSGNDYGTAFHDLSEGMGFIYSLQFLPVPGGSQAYFSREEVQAFLDRLTEGNGLWEVTPETLDAMSEEIADKFDFTVAQAGS